MKTILKPTSLNERSYSVNPLHKALAALGSPIDKAEVTNNYAGENTLQQVRRLQANLSVNRALSTLGHLDIPQEQLALWTILAMRWPKLAEHLEEEPEDVQRIGKKEEPEGKSSISKLFDDEEVIKVVQGDRVAAGLDVKAVERCALLRM